MGRTGRSWASLMRLSRGLMPVGGGVIVHGSGRWGCCGCCWVCLCLYGHCHWVLGAVVVGVVAVVGIVGCCCCGCQHQQACHSGGGSSNGDSCDVSPMIDKHMLNKQTTRIPLHSVPANSVEHFGLNSRMAKLCQNDQALE